jgi:hypothetical protein
MQTACISTNVHEIYYKPIHILKPWITLKLMYKMWIPVVSVQLNFSFQIISDHIPLKAVRSKYSGFNDTHLSRDMPSGFPHRCKIVVSHRCFGRK